MDEKKSEDLWMKLYERNEQYHDAKEKTIWLGGTVYATFSLAVIKLVTDYKCQIEMIQDLKCRLKWALGLFGFCIGWFVLYQIRAKCESAVKTGKYHKLLPVLRQASYEKIIKDTQFPPEERRGRFTKRLKALWQNGLPGFLIFIPMIILFIIQMKMLSG